MACVRRKIMEYFLTLLSRTKKKIINSQIKEAQYPIVCKTIINSKLKN